MKKNLREKKILSTFEREMKDIKFKKAFEKSYREFLLSEQLIEKTTKKSKI